jgi:hypothetical protein
MVTAVATDELKYVRVAAFSPALYHADRLAPQDHRRPKCGLITGLHGCLLPVYLRPGGVIDVSRVFSLAMRPRTPRASSPRTDGLPGEPRTHAGPPEDLTRLFADPCESMTSVLSQSSTIPVTGGRPGAQLL